MHVQILDHVFKHTKTHGSESRAQGGSSETYTLKYFTG